MAAALFACVVLMSCGPNIGNLEKGEEGSVTRALGGDTLELDSGLRVFLAEIDAPRGEEEYAAQSRAELEALALHRKVRLAYGGTRRWVRRVREGELAPEPQGETAVAHVFVQSEGGRWFWLQHELVARGAAYVRPRRDNHARGGELMALEVQARTGERGLWAKRTYRALNPGEASAAALAFADSCQRAAAPYRIVEGRVASVFQNERRAALDFDTTEETGVPGFSAVVFGEAFSGWDGEPLQSFSGARVRVRGPLGVFRDAPQICIDSPLQIETLKPPA
ncbi:MAG: thermonuclease family protein [Terricaulis sp.]